MITILEIFTNLFDLEISITKQKNGNKFAFDITRGPMHNFKPLLSADPYIDNIDIVIIDIEILLNKIREKGEEIFKRKADEDELNTEAIKKIIGELKKK